MAEFCILPRCFICDSPYLCSHREPELHDLWLAKARTAQAAMQVSRDAEEEKRSTLVRKATEALVSRQLKFGNQEQIAALRLLSGEWMQ